MKKSILIAVYNLEIGGIERSLINMLENIDYENYSVDLLIYHHIGEFMKIIPKKVNILPQIDEYSLFRKPVMQCIKEGYYTIPVIRVISKAIANIKAKRAHLLEGSGYIQMQIALKLGSFFLPRLSKSYDLAISYAWPHDIIANKVLAKKKIAWIHTDYSNLEIDNKIDLKVWKKFDFVAAVSEECSNSFLRQYPSLEQKMLVIENITSPKLIKDLAEVKNEHNPITHKNFNILTVGRLSYVKGFDLAVESLRILHDRGLKNVKWYVVGYGGFEKELKELITKKKLKESFILLGKKTNPYLYMKTCDLYVQPSRYEGKAVTVTEAKILGKPILITKYPTSESQLEDGVEGIICELSVNGLVDGIMKLVENPNLRNELAKNNLNADYRNTTELEKIYRII